MCEIPRFYGPKAMSFITGGSDENLQRLLHKCRQDSTHKSVDNVVIILVT